MGCQAIGLFEKVSEFEVVLHYYYFRHLGLPFVDTEKYLQNLIFVGKKLTISSALSMSKNFSRLSSAADWLIS